MQLHTAKIKKKKKKWHLIFFKDGHHQIAHSACPPYRVTMMLFPFERWRLCFLLLNQGRFLIPEEGHAVTCNGIRECYSAFTGLFWDICSWNPAVMPVKPKLVHKERKCRETTRRVPAEIHAEVPASHQSQPADIWMETSQVVPVLQSHSHTLFPSPRARHSHLYS